MAEPGSAPWEQDFERAALALRRRTGVSHLETVRLRSLVREAEEYPARSTITSFATTDRLKWIVSGWACELRALPDSSRQIFSFLVPGDVMVCRPIRPRSPCLVLTLTRMIGIDLIQTLGPPADDVRPELWMAMTSAMRQGEARRYEHMIRLGQHSAEERLIDLLLDLKRRLSDLDLVRNDTFRLPLTQEHIADALGLSEVHVNRTLKRLRLAGLLEIKFGAVTLQNADQLEQVLASGALGPSRGELH